MCVCNCVCLCLCVLFVLTRKAEEQQRSQNEPHNKCVEIFKQKRKWMNRKSHRRARWQWWRLHIIIMSNVVIMCVVVLLKEVSNICPSGVVYHISSNKRYTTLRETFHSSLFKGVTKANAKPSFTWVKLVEFPEEIPLLSTSQSINLKYVLHWIFLHLFFLLHCHCKHVAYFFLRWQLPS